MPKVSSFAPGLFCWVELSTTDAKAAKSFYTEAFGWSVNEVPMGEQASYFIFQLEGRDAAAMYEQSPDEKVEEIPPHWNSYVSVSRADSAAQKAVNLGGHLIAGPFDVMDLGRMAILMDPQRAMFAVWEAKTHGGAGVVNEPGALCWNELYAPDLSRARSFYTSLFGWKMKVSPEYTEIYNGETPIGGIMQIPEIPPNWIPYFGVNDADAFCWKASSLGAAVHKEPTDIPNAGRFAILSDPQGAVFAIIKH